MAANTGIYAIFVCKYNEHESGISGQFMNTYDGRIYLYVPAHEFADYIYRCRINRKLGDDMYSVTMTAKEYARVLLETS